MADAGQLDGEERVAWTVVDGELEGGTSNVTVPHPTPRTGESEKK